MPGAGKFKLMAWEIRIGKPLDLFKGSVVFVQPEVVDLVLFYRNNVGIQEIAIRTDLKL